MHKAVGTSLMVIALKSFAAYAGHASHVTVDLELAGMVTVGALLGSVVGGVLAHRVPAKLLRKGFSFFVLAMAGYVVWREAGLTPALVVTGIVLPLMAAIYWRNRANLAAETEEPVAS